MNISTKKIRFILIISTIFTFIQPNNPTPLSFCTKGRISNNINYDKGACGLEKLPTNKKYIGTLSSNFFPAAINQDLFKSAAQCGICYEMVGPIGAIRVRVEDYCSKDNENGFCKGDIPHFNVANNGTSYIMGNADNANITFRMISCDYIGNIRIFTDEKVSKNYLSFVVLDHNIGVSFIEMRENNTNIWINLTRSNDNNWVYYDLKNGITFPLILRIYSINGDYVNVKMNTLEGNKYYEADNNFILKIDENYFFNISTLKKINTNNNNTIRCCERDKTDFTPIYSNGYVNGGYNDYKQKVNVIYNLNDSLLGKYSMKAKFESFGKLTFESSFPIRADQYTGVLFSIKTNQICSDCLYVRAYGINGKNHIISFDELNVWKNYSISFDDLDIKNNEFNGIVFNYNKNTDEYFEVIIDIIELIPNPSAPDASLCADSLNKNNNKIMLEQNADNDDNGNSSYIQINSIIINENAPKVLNIKCEQFTNYDNKEINLRLTPKNNGALKNVDITNCTSNSSVINSFTCTLPSTISDGFYKIKTQTTDGFNFNFTYDKDVEIKNGLFICGNVDPRIRLYSLIKVFPIIVIYSKEQIINKGDNVKFDVYPIPQDQYKLKNDEIILFNNNENKSLCLKNCSQNVKDKIIYSIQCVVSDNIMKDNYTTFYTGRYTFLLDGQTINLTVSNSNGGMIRNSLSQTISTDLTQSQKQNLNTTFEVLYYNSSVKPGNKFPHKIVLYGTKKNSDTQNDTQISFQNCTAGGYYQDDTNAIGSINCRVPDYVPAGTYSNFESDGIDMNPKHSINLVFEEDFNRSSTSTKSNSTEITYSKSSSSKSKAWIIGLVLGIVALIIIGVVITLLVCRKSKNINISDKKVNDTSAAKNFNYSQ